MASSQLEIKCPKSKDSKLLAEAKAGRVPVHVYWQMQTQLLVSGARLAHLYVFDGTTGILLEQKPEPEVWDTIRREWDRFMELVRTRSAAAVDRPGYRDSHRCGVARVLPRSTLNSSGAR